MRKHASATIGTLVLALLLQLPTPGLADMESASWAALKNGDHVALLRHVHAPGTGDPPGFRLDDCATQRNLSEAGREQARTIGARFREHGIVNVVIYSSQWCRCMETAKLLGLGKVNPLPGVELVFSRRRPGSRTDRRSAGADQETPRGDVVRPGHPSGQYRRARRREPAIGRDRGASPRW